MSIRNPNRREVLTFVAVTAVGGALLPRTLLAQAGADTSRLIGNSDICVLVPEVTEGPYYFDPALVRRDITEGRPGAPLTMRLQVVDQACLPREGARVDIWHCDATGLYSGYVNQADSGSVSAVGETFLRGTQFTDADGIVEFASIYPGWYRGRTTHIHFKVFLDETNVLTGQIFFDDTLTDQIYASIAPYNTRTATRDQYNSTDSIARQAGAASIASLVNENSSFVAELVVGIDPNAVSQATGMPGGAGGPGGGPGGPPPGLRPF